MQLVGLYRYPVKSLGGTSLEAAALDRFGVSGDRRWMVVDSQSRFVTQREVRELALIATATDVSGNLQLSRNGQVLEVSVPAADAERRKVVVWRDTVSASDAGEAAANWLTETLGVACRLVYMADDVVRHVNPDFADQGESVAFADGYPLLLIGQASLDDLNARLPSPVAMNRFRPNLVVDGAMPFAEDEWRRVRIGAVECEVVKPCSRCVIPSIVQEDASRDPDINRVLAGFRRRDGVIYFGQNLLHRGQGELRLGDPVEVLA